MTEAEGIAERAARARLVFGIALGGVCLLAVAGLVVGILASVVNARQGDDITNVTRRVESACAVNASGEKCQQIKREADEERSVRDTCIAFWKVGYSCPAPSSGVRLPAAAGGDALQPAQAGQQSAPTSVGDEGDQGDEQPHSSVPQPKGSPPPLQPAGKVAPAPSSTPAAQGEPESPGPPTTSSPEPEPEHSEPGVLDPVLTGVCSLADLLAHLCS
jgi:hypothetical protein